MGRVTLLGLGSYDGSHTVSLLAGLNVFMRVLLLHCSVARGFDKEVVVSNSW